MFRRRRRRFISLGRGGIAGHDDESTFGRAITGHPGGDRTERQEKVRARRENADALSVLQSEVNNPVRLKKHVERHAFDGTFTVDRRHESLSPSLSTPLHSLSLSLSLCPSLRYSARPHPTSRHFPSRFARRWRRDVVTTRDREAHATRRKGRSLNYIPLACVCTRRAQQRRRSRVIPACSRTARLRENYGRDSNEVDTTLYRAVCAAHL